MLNAIEDIMLYDDHQDSDKPNSISATTLLGPLYKAKKYLARDTKDESLIAMMYKRSSFIGTAIHSRAEYITKDREDYIVEQFLEREILVDGIVYTVAGKFDFLKNIDGKWYIGDYKSGYGKERNADALSKDAMQMSIYRWMLETVMPDIEIEDTCYSIFISQSNNVMKEYPVALKSTNDVQDYIEEKLFAITQTESSDCNVGVKYNSCTYCSYECDERKK